MKPLIFLSLIVFAQAIEHRVKTSTELNNALNNVIPGDTITLADGTYSGTFKILRSGNSVNQITMTGTKNAIFTSTSYGIHLQASYWTLRGFTVANTKKGIVLDGAKFNILDNLSVHHCNEEAVHFRKSSTDNTIKNSIISYTGLTSPGVGEGVYIGSAVSNWETVMGSFIPDKSHRNKVLNNKFGPGITAEAIDIKEGSESGLIDGNTFDGTGMTGVNYGDSWIDLKGANYVISNNVGSKSLLDGIQVHVVANSVANSGCNNKIINNTCSKLGTGGVCVNLYKIACTNTNTNNIIV